MDSEKDEGKIIHVPTKPGKHDLHYEGTGEFAPKDGTSKETYDVESKKYSIDDISDDEFDLSSIDDLELDDDLFDLDDLSSLEIDEDLQSLSVEDDLIDVEAEMAKIPTLKDYRKTRETRIARETPVFSYEKAVEWRKKMREIIDESLPVSRIPTKYFYDLIISGKFMNQFEAKHSKGFYASDDTDGGYRGTMSRTCFGTKTSGSTIEDRYKWEKYGTFCPKNDLNSIFDDKDGARDQYGDIVCVYNNKVRPFTTYTMADSLSFSDQHPILLSDTPDEFCMHRSDRRDVVLEDLKKCKDMNDIKEMLGTSYYETQIHVPDLTIEDYISAIAIPHSQMNGSYYSDKYRQSFKIEDVMKIAKEKYPNLSFFSRDRVGRIRKVFINDTGEIEWEKKDFIPEL